MKPIAIFYHCLFHLGNPPSLKQSAISVIREQMFLLKESGLLDSAEHLVAGINGGDESKVIAKQMIPTKFNQVFHGLESRAENLTIIELEKWVPTHPGWNVLYFHAKGCTHDSNSEYGRFSTRWRRCMMKRCVGQWKEALAILDGGLDAVGCHWLTGMGSDRSQHFFAGNFWWATSDFLNKVPSMFLRDRIKTSGIKALESRYESEVWIGNGPMPKIKDLEPTHGLGQCP